MKIQSIIIMAAVAFLAVACKESAPSPQSNAAPAPAVRGQAIAKLQEPEPAPVAKPEPPAPVDKVSVENPKPVTDVRADAQTDIKEIARQAALETSSAVTLAAVETVNQSPVETKASGEANPAPASAEKNDGNPAPKKPADEKKDGEFLEVGFDKLAGFEYDVPEEEFDPDKKPAPKDQPDQIPANIKAFNKKRVALKGFMMPLKVEDGLITEMLIMRDQSACCYGTVPKINEWVSVKMTGKGVKPIMDQIITVFGRLKVGEMRENGYLIGIYEMDGEKIIGPLEF